MPLRQAIIFSYYTQAGHCLLGAAHLWCALQGGSPTFNIIMAVLNGLFYVYNANWRARMRASLGKR